MASDSFIFDEWLLHDLGGDNGLENQAEAASLLQKLKVVCDKIAVAYGSSWLAKAYQLMTNSDVRVRMISQYLHNVILADPAKCRFTYEADLVALPGDLIALIPATDRYLFRLYRTVGAVKLVTTDGPLTEIDCTPFGFEVSVQLREAFLSEYL